MFSVLQFCCYELFNRYTVLLFTFVFHASLFFKFNLRSLDLHFPVLHFPSIMLYGPASSAFSTRVLFWSRIYSPAFSAAPFPCIIYALPKNAISTYLLSCWNKLVTLQCISVTRHSVTSCSVKQTVCTSLKYVHRESLKTRHQTLVHIFAK